MPLSIVPFVIIYHHSLAAVIIRLIEDVVVVAAVWCHYLRWVSITSVKIRCRRITNPISLFRAMLNMLENVSRCVSVEILTAYFISVVDGWLGVANVLR